jgi:hypothetical protein
MDRCDAYYSPQLCQALHEKWLYRISGSTQQITLSVIAELASSSMPCPALHLDHSRTSQASRGLCLRG